MEYCPESRVEAEYGVDETKEVWKGCPHDALLQNPAESVMEVAGETKG
jgi:hypothetical protein